MQFLPQPAADSRDPLAQSNEREKDVYEENACLFCTIDSYIFPRTTPVEVEQDVKNNLEEVRKKK